MSRPRSGKASAPSVRWREKATASAPGEFSFVRVLTMRKPWTDAAMLVTRPGARLPKFFCSGCLGELPTHNRRPDKCDRCGSFAFMRTRRAGEIVLFAGAALVPCERCSVIGGDLHLVTFRRIVALGWIDRIHTCAGYVCSRCRRQLFLRHQGSTLAFGWLGLLAFCFRNPIAILMNFGSLVGKPGYLGLGTTYQELLDGRREQLGQEIAAGPPRAGGVAGMPLARNNRP